MTLNGNAEWACPDCGRWQIEGALHVCLGEEPEDEALNEIQEMEQYREELYVSRLFWGAA